MGLSQNIKFSARRDDVIKILDVLEFNKQGDEFYVYTTDGCKIEVYVTSFGLHIHRSGNYFEELGKLVEGLGNITSSITIEDE